MNVTARHDLPSREKELFKLAYLLKYPDAQSLTLAVRSCRQQVREDFEAILGKV
jgi:glutamine synthetase adenylyltransferase